MPAPVTIVKTTNVKTTKGNGQPDSLALVDVLVKTGDLSLDLAQKIKLQEIQTGKTQEEIIKTGDYATPSALSKAKASLYNVPFLPVSEIPVNPEALSLLPKEVAQQFTILPTEVDKTKGELTLVMANPLDLEAIEFVEQKTNMHVRPIATVPEDLARLIREQYTIGFTGEVSRALEETTKPQALDVRDLGRVIKEAPIAKIVTEMLEFAVKSRASDIHIEAEENRSRIRYRIDGILYEKLTLPREVHEALVSRAKILSGMKIDERRIPQDGRFTFKTGREEIDLRVSSLPTVHGEKIVMRLLKKTGGVPDLPELGLRAAALKNLQEGILRPHGIVIVCGPTGSGKTTTLYSVLSRINSPRVNIITLEDPIEYQIPGVNQVQVNPAAGLTFASGLRSFLRQDPNIIMVGEIRDRETTDLAIQASLTGHLVFSTLHTNDAAGALPRLLDMGAEPFLLASSITALVAQRVVRKIHEACRTSYDPPEGVVSDLKEVLGKLWPDSKKLQLFKGKGDEECNNTGYFGRTGIFEVMPVSEKISKLILERAPAGALQRQAADDGMITMKQDGYLKALEGITSIEEILRVAQE